MANLSPELLKLLQGQDAATINKNTLLPQLVDGRYYQQNYAGGGGGGEGGFDNPGTLTGYTGYDQKWGDMGGDGKEQKKANATQSVYDADGTYKGEKMWGVDDWKTNLVMMIVSALTMGAALPAMAGAAGAGGAGGAGAMVAGDAFMPGMLGVGGSEVAMGSLIPGLEAYAVPAAAGAAGGGTFNAAMDSQLANTALGGDALSGYTAAGTGGVTASPVGGGGGLLGSLGNSASSAGSSLSSMLGGGGGTGGLGQLATLAGGLLGSKGTDNSQTTQNRADPRMDPLLYGPNGLFARAQGLLDTQMAPGYLQGFEDMRKAGQGLLATPARGNGFNLLTGR